MFKTVEDHNDSINARGYVGYEGSFIVTFRDRKKVMFTVKYGEYGKKKQDPYFATTAGQFNYGRTDWDSCGQAQEILKNKKLVSFFKKWDTMHLKILTFDEYDELIEDLYELKKEIPYVESDNFSSLVDFDRSFS